MAQQPDFARMIRRDVRMMVNLVGHDQLTAERFEALTARLLETADQLEAHLDGLEPEEFFDVTPSGIHALGAAPIESEQRAYGPLRCIDGGLS